MKQVFGAGKWKKIALLAGFAVLLAACGDAAGKGETADGGNGAGQEASVSYRDDVATADLQEAVAQELGDNYWPNMEMPAELLEDTFGISAEMYEEITVQTPMISANVDTLIIVKAKEGSEAQVEQVLQDYKEYNTTEALQYPMNMGKVQAAQIATYGRYVCFVQLGAEIPETEGASEEESDAAAILHCEKENAKALAVIEEMLKK